MSLKWLFIQNKVNIHKTIYPLYLKWFFIQNKVNIHKTIYPLYLKCMNPLKTITYMNVDVVLTQWQNNWNTYV